MDSIALALNPQVASLNIIPHHYQSQAAFGVSRMIGNGNNLYGMVLSAAWGS